MCIYSKSTSTLSYVKGETKIYSFVTLMTKTLSSYLHTKAHAVYLNSKSSLNYRYSTNLENAFEG